MSAKHTFLAIQQLIGLIASKTQHQRNISTYHELDYEPSFLKGTFVSWHSFFHHTFHVTCTVKCLPYISNGLQYLVNIFEDYNLLAPIAQRPDNFIQWISHYPTVYICTKISVFPLVQGNMYTLTTAKFGSVRKPWTTFNVK